MADFPTNFFNSAAFGPNAPSLGIDFGSYGSSVFKDSVPGYGGQLFTPSPEKPGNSFAQTALGVGALAEGIGNVIRAAKGMEPGPPGMAGSFMGQFMQQNQDTALEKILDRLFTETKSKFDSKDEETQKPSTQPSPLLNDYF